MIINLRMDTIMIRAGMFICLFLLNATLNFSQTTYYISSSQGNDNNSGISEESPWQTISKVNSMKFLPGDNILFKRGDKWTEGIGLVINNSGTEGNRITYGVYGTGTKPIISMERTLTGTWANLGSNIWELNISNFDGNMRRLWLDDVSIKIIASNYDLYQNQGTSSGPMAVTDNITSASQVQTLNSEYRWNSYTGYIKLFSTTNPGTTYSSIKTYYPALPITIQNANYVTIKDIMITRAYRGIYIPGSSHVTLDNVDIYDVYSSAVYATKSGNTKSNYLEVKNCNFNSGLDDVEGVNYEYNYCRGGFALNISNGADYANIHNNIFKDFTHTNGPILLGNIAEGDSATSNYNEVYDNVMDMSGINYGRAVSMGGTQESCHDNRFYRNKIIHQNIGMQVGGYHNYIYYNIVVSDTLRGRYKEDETFVINWTNAFGGMVGIVNDNFFFNNTIYACKGILVLTFGSRNNMFNNLVVNYHRVQMWDLPVMFLPQQTGNTIYKNNYFYSPYVDHSGVEVRYNNKTWSGTISAWNSADVNGDDISGNTVLTSNPVTSETTFDVSGSVVNAGINISSYVPVGFTTDRNGNTISKTTPNIGAIDNSAQEPTDLQIYLQGAYSNGVMKTALKEGGLILKAQPYNASPWNYNGNESVLNIPSNIVDWVLIELRSDISASSIVAKRAGFVRNDGGIVDLDGASKLHFDGVNSGNYYIVIRHRNHLSVMSSVQVPISGSSIQYDFTASRSSAYGNDEADLGSGKFGMYAGDGDANGTVNVLDYGTVGNKLFQTGYFQGDLDLNGTVNVLDYGKTNSNLLKFSNVP